MPIVTKITQQKRDKERFNIFLDGEYAFSVHESVLVKFGLTKGMELDDWSLGDITYEAEIEKAFNRALHYLGFRMRSEHEVKEKLLVEEYGEAVVLEALAKLKRLNFLDDVAFTEAFVRTKVKSSQAGPTLLKQQLTQKGIDPALQERVIAEYATSEQYEVALALAEKVARRSENISPRQAQQKMQQTLLRKGFSYELIRDVIENVDVEREEDEWEAIIEREGEKAWRRLSRKHDGYQLRQRVKQTLYQKGIPFDRIDQFIEEKENEENE